MNEAPGYGIAKTSVLEGLHHEYRLVKEAAKRLYGCSVKNC